MSLPPPNHSKIQENQTFSFNQLPTTREFQFPSVVDESICPPFNHLSDPHLLSFNCLWNMKGLNQYIESLSNNQSSSNQSSTGQSSTGQSSQSTESLINTSPVGILQLAVNNLDPVTLFDGLFKHKDSVDTSLSLGNHLSIQINHVNVGKPIIANSPLYPTECRQRGISYKAPMQAQITYSVKDENGNHLIPPTSIWKDFGQLPVMVRSIKCNLENLSVQQRMKHGEEALDLGGYFIINGIERLIRLLIAPRRNYPLALIRPSFQKRGARYTSYGVQIRSVRMDQSSMTTTLHYLDDGSCTFRFSWRKQEYIVPLMLILRALTGASDEQIYNNLISNGQKDTWVTDRIELLLKSMKSLGLYTKEAARSYLGSKFAVMLDAPENLSNLQVGTLFLEKCVLIHLSNDTDKFNLMIFMIQKLYALARGVCSPDNPDSPSHQELLLPGYLYNTILKERFQDYLYSIKQQIMVDLKRSVGTRIDDVKYLQKVFGKVNSDIGKKMSYFLATGNLVSNTGLDLQQVSGYTIVAERLNHYRYLSHFRSVHRGAFFAELKTTTVRKLLPESWGFLCPVHTPDGSPCGLLNHLSHTCQVCMECLVVPSKKIEEAVKNFGISSIPLPQESQDILDRNITIQLDGRIIGYTTVKHGIKLHDALRVMKCQGLIVRDVELVLILPSNGGTWPGLFMFTAPGRFLRKVRFLGLPGEVTDFIGSLEQTVLNIACLKDDLTIEEEEGDELMKLKKKWTHVEWLPTDMLSVIANLTPFSDFNQSPRNMYQCQMGKQTMGTPAHGISKRSDNKLYRIQSPQTPIVRPKLHDYYKMDEYPQGTNAVVAVISYTGYDMEDAMILNKSSDERGFGYGQIYKTEFIDLTTKQRRGEDINIFFGLKCKNGKKMSMEQEVKIREFLDMDGLPQVGIKLKQGDPYYCWCDEITGQIKVEKYKSLEEAYVESVGLLGNDNGTQPLQKISIRLRIPRPPIIGDKFSSRHGQKGVCSQKYPQIDLPFSESGISPDVIINPHAFPSRMTIGMFVESLAGKTGAMMGVTQDATPFTIGEGSTRSIPHTTALEFFGEELVKCGYNYYGNETMYSGITGQEFKADIYIGLVYYQRLRHMVADKYQVRTTGPVHNLTQQPVKGRKRAGGIRFGEMERDSLLAHGVSYLLQDRLMNCSDYSQSYVCKQCGSILSPVTLNNPHPTSRRQRVSCQICSSSDYMDVVAIPYVFRYLCTELLAMGINVKLEV